MKKILVLRYRFIGDTILTVPFLRNLRYAEPDAYIAWVVAPGSSEIVRGIPYVDEMIMWDPVTIHADSRGGHRTWGAKLAFLRDLRSRRFDKVYVLKRSFSSAIMGFLSGASERIGFDTEGRGFLLTRRVPYRHDLHEVMNFLEVLRADGLPVRDDRLEIWTSPEEDAEAERLLAEAGRGDLPLAVLHPFSADTRRGWPMENFALLAGELRKMGFHPVILGGGRDGDDLDPFRDTFGDFTDMVGRCSLRVTAALLRRAALFVGNDSGIMHLAAAAGIPIVALFGPQSPVKFGPWGEKTRVIYHGFDCSPCRQKFFTECRPGMHGRPECMESITVGEVVDACRDLLFCGGEGTGND
jgi:heptosyltransferase II